MCVQAGERIGSVCEMKKIVSNAFGNEDHPTLPGSKEPHH